MNNNIRRSVKYIKKILSQINDKTRLIIIKTSSFIDYDTRNLFWGRIVLIEKIG